jgi:hypothetical protein
MGTGRLFSGTGGGEWVICISIFVISAYKAIDNYEHFIFDLKLNFSK